MHIRAEKNTISIKCLLKSSRKVCGNISERAMQQVQTVAHRFYKGVVQVKRMNIVVIDGEERELGSLPIEVQEKLAAEWNRRALAVIGYEEKKTA